MFRKKLHGQSLKPRGTCYAGVWCATLPGYTLCLKTLEQDFIFRGKFVRQGSSVLQNSQNVFVGHAIAISF